MYECFQRWIRTPRNKEFPKKIWKKKSKLQFHDTPVFGILGHPIHHFTSFPFHIHEIIPPSNLTQPSRPNSGLDIGPDRICSIAVNCAFRGDISVFPKYIDRLYISIRIPIPDWEVGGLFVDSSNDEHGLKFLCPADRAGDEVDADCEGEEGEKHCEGRCKDGR